MTRRTPEPLQAAPVYSQLGWRWTWRGFTVVHLSLVLGPTLVLYPMVWWCKAALYPALPLACAFLPSLALAAFVGVAQYGQHPDTLFQELRAWLSAPLAHHLSPFKAEPDAWQVHTDTQVRP